MKGTDVTQEELDNAETFYGITNKVRPFSKEYRITHADLIRLLAWYGKIRANGDGSGCLNIDGKPVRTEPSR